MTQLIQSTPLRRAVAACIALLAWAALAMQLWLTMGIVLAQGRGFGMGLVVFFGFFTVLTNLLAALVMTGHASSPGSAAYAHAASPVVLTTTAAAITMVGAVYFQFFATRGSRKGRNFGPMSRCITPCPHWWWCSGPGPCQPVQ